MKKNILALSIMMCAVLLFFQGGVAEEKAGASSKKQGSIFKTAGTPAAALLNINRISSWYESNGECERNPATGNAGLTYPRGTSQAIYASGLIWSGKVSDGKTPALRAGGSDYNRGVQPGAIIGTRTGKYEDAAASDVRIWRIRRDYAVADLRQDAAETKVKALGSVNDGDIAEIRAQYEKDWKEWPAQKGAPYYDKNHNGVYDPKFVTLNNVLQPDTSSDSPGLADADQVIWFVCHDLAGVSQWASPPIGLEQQTTIWGYNRSDALGNMVFKKFKLIYKGTATTPPNAKIDEMYLSQWSDPDLGDAGDDFAGCDTVLSLGYVYNSTTLDKNYRPYGIAPPASGYDFLQGPIVPAPGKTAVFDLKYKKDYMNLPMTSFIYFAGNGIYSDPPHTAAGVVQWNQMLRGLPPTPAGPPDPDPLIDPKTGLSTLFWLPGDPVGGKGWLDGSIDAPGDRRLVLASGPFTMAVDDTQELVSATVCGLGSDRLSSVAVLKFYDQTAQSAYDNLFDLPKPPPAPDFTIVELDKALVIEWEKDSSSVATTENSNSKGYKFEGYNVYQLPSASSQLSSGVKIGTFDLITDPSTVTQQEFDEASGQILAKPVQLGKNSGLSRYMLLTTDAIKNRPFINGQRYYFAVTAYNFIDDALKPTRSYESSPAIQEAIPHMPNPGVVLPYKIQDTLTLPTKNVFGSNDASVGGVVFNPTLQKGNTFDVWYGGTDDSKAGGPYRNWTVVRNISGTDYASVTATIDSTLSGANVGGVSRATSKGFGVFTINDAKTQIRYSIKIDNVSSSIDSAYISLGPAKKIGTVVKTLNFGTGATSGVASGTWTTSDATEILDSALIVAFTSGNLYVVIHTAKYPAGEIRGQIADGLFPRDVIATAVTPLPPLATNTEHRVPADGISFYAGPAPNGFRSATQTAPASSNVVNIVNPEGTYRMIGPSAAWGGARSTEATLEIRFQAGENWAIVNSANGADLTPAKSYFMRVPFAVYRDTTRVMPAIADMAGDTLWNTVGDTVINGVKTWDKIGVVDTIDGNGNTIKYYSLSPLPPVSTVIKGRLTNGVNHIGENIVFTNEKGDGAATAAGTNIKIVANVSIKPGDIKTLTLNTIQAYNATTAKQDVNKVNIFPNPYYGVNSSETSREVRFVTLSHLPQKATIRIFNIAGTLIRTLLKDDASQFLQWDLLNEKRLPVASGMYILHVDMGDLGVKVLKCAIIQEQQFLRNY